MYFYKIYHGPGARMKVRFNDIPVYVNGDGDEGLSTTTTNSVTELLQEGENSFTIEIYQAQEHIPLFFEVSKNWEDQLRRIDWPEVKAEWPDEKQSLPLVHRELFMVDEPVSKPVYVESVPMKFGPEGTPELRQAVSEFHSAVADRDIDRFVSHVDLKSEELLRAYDNDSEFSTASARREIGEFFQSDTETRELDLDELVFESCHQGKVAFVTRADGGPAIDSMGPEGYRFATNLWLTWYHGAWKIFR